MKDALVYLAMQDKVLLHACPYTTRNTGTCKKHPSRKGTSAIPVVPP